MSSRSNSSASTRTSSSSSFSSSLAPDPSKLTHYLRELIVLARTTLTPKYNAIRKFRYTHKYQCQSERINAYFTKHRGGDFDAMLMCVLEMQIVARMIERGLTLEGGKVDWPVCALAGEDEEGMRKGAHKRVEGWVFGGREVVMPGDEEIRRPAKISPISVEMSIPQE